MEDILEFILSILFMPFESKYDNLKIKINRIPNKALKIFLKVLLVLIPFALIFGLYCLCSYIFRGYWI
ncbi:MAG: hypothetical protein IKY41_09420 [Clostridia bacterium]|nr:hypothetical protein [Clostridia bacterium]